MRTTGSARWVLVRRTSTPPTRRGESRWRFAVPSLRKIPRRRKNRWRTLADGFSFEGEEHEEVVRKADGIGNGDRGRHRSGTGRVRCAGAAEDQDGAARPWPGDEVRRAAQLRCRRRAGPSDPHRDAAHQELRPGEKL